LLCNVLLDGGDDGVAAVTIHLFVFDRLYLRAGKIS